MSSQETSGICRVCLAINVKIYNIKNSRLQVLYKNIICAEYEFDFVLDIGVDFGVCYICYAQLLKIHKFAELAQTSGKRLKFFKDRGMAMMSIRSFNFYNLHKKHNLSITVIPPIYIQNNTNTENEQIKYEHGTSENCEKLNSCDIEKHKLTMTLPMQDNSQTQSPIQSESLIANEGIQGGIARSNSICDEYVTSSSNPVSMKKENFDHEYISDHCELFNNCDKEQSMLTISQNIIGLSQSPKQTNIIDVKREKCALSKPVTDLNVTHSISFKEEYIEQNTEYISDDCEMSNNCEIENPTLTMPPESIDLTQSPIQTETFVGTKRNRRGCAFSELIEQQREKVELDEFRNDIAVANTPCTRKTLKRKNDMHENNIDRKDVTIDELIQMLIKIHKESIKTKKQNDRWCGRSQELLIQLIRLAGSEQAGTKVLTDRVFPLFPQGFVRLPTLATLLRMARNRKNKEADYGERKSAALNERKGLQTFATNMHPSILRLAKSVAETVEAKLHNSNLMSKHEELSKLSHLNKTSTVNDLRETSMFTLPPKETKKTVKHRKQNVVLINNCRKISNNKEDQKLAQIHKQSSEAETRPSGSTVSKDTGYELEVMLNKFSKFKEKLDSQNK